MREKMNNTKWREILERFYSIECGENNIAVPWMTKCRSNGYLYGWDYTWTHFGDASPDNNKGMFEDIEWLKIQLTNQNRHIVLSILSDIHVPGKVEKDCVTVYGYSDTYIDYIQYPEEKKA